MTQASEAEGGQSKHSARSWLFTLFKYGLSAIAFGFVACFVDLKTAWEHILNQSPKYVAIAAAVLSLQVVLGGLRWHAILARLGTKPKMLASIRLYYISVFFNSYFWGAVGGDLLRAWLTYRGPVSGKTAVNSVILDRVAALAGVAILAVVTAPIYLSHIGSTLQILIPIGAALIGLAGIAFIGQLDRIPEAWLSNKFTRLLHSLGGSVRLVFLDPAGAISALGFAIAAQLALGFATYAVAESLSIQISLINCIVLMQPVAILANLPISIGGWGVRESAVVVLFGLVGVPTSAALILSVQLGLLSLLVALPGGILWLLLKPKSQLP